MRTSVFSLVVALLLAACSSGTTYVVQQPAPAPIEPLELALGRPHAGQLYVQTNRPAYVAVFEIIPERGVVIVHPSTSRQQRQVVAGIDRIPLWWEQGRTTAAGRPMPGEPMRYIYAIASDRPLRLTDDVFEPGYFQRTMGIDGRTAAANPYATMRSISRRFVVATTREEAWAEDVVVHGDPRVPHSTRVARLYCADGTVIEVPADMADRALCPARSSGTSARTPARPDSVKTESGQHVATRRPDPLQRGGSRIGEPEGDRRGIPVRGRPAPVAAADAATPQQPAPVAAPAEPAARPGNGNGNANGRPQNPGRGQNGNEGRGQNENQGRGQNENPGRGQQCRPDVPGEPPCRPVTPGENAPGRPENPGANAPGRAETPAANAAGRPENPGANAPGRPENPGANARGRQANQPGRPASSGQTSAAADTAAPAPAATPGSDAPGRANNSTPANAGRRENPGSSAAGRRETPAAAPAPADTLPAVRPGNSGNANRPTQGGAERHAAPAPAAETTPAATQPAPAQPAPAQPAPAQPAPAQPEESQPGRSRAAPGRGARPAAAPPAAAPAATDTAKAPASGEAPATPAPTATPAPAAADSTPSKAAPAAQSNRPASAGRPGGRP